MTGTLLDVVTAEAARSRDFRHLASNCLGAWPVSILECLEQLASKPGHLREVALRLAEDAQLGTSDWLSPEEGLPLEHPLDGDWRFASGVPESLLNRLRAVAGPDGRILIACAPTLVLAAARLGVSHQLAVAIRDKDPISRVLPNIAPDALYVDFNELTGLEASAGMIDPPWYDDIAAPLVQRVSAGVREGGSLFICGPDLMTTASNARALTGGAAGLSHVLIPLGKISRVRYRTPRFEYRALQAAGIGSVPTEWRTGLLRQFARTGRSEAPSTPLVPEDSWMEMPSTTSRVWLRPSAAKGGSARIVISESVSRTSPLRKIASVWTSGNTVVIGGTPAEIKQLAFGSEQPASELWKRLEDADSKSCWRRRCCDLRNLAPSEPGWDNSLKLQESGFPAILPEM